MPSVMRWPTMTKSVDVRATSIAILAQCPNRHDANIHAYEGIVMSAAPMHFTSIFHASLIKDSMQIRMFSNSAKNTFGFQGKQVSAQHPDGRIESRR